MKHSLIYSLLLISGLSTHAQVKRPLPVIDMHLHAIGADDQGPPPLSLGAPFKEFGPFDPKENYGDVFMKALKTGAWNEKTITSPTTDQALRDQSLAQLQKNNVYAVTSGDIPKVRQWKTLAPERIIPGVYWNFNMLKTQKLTVDSLTKLFKSREFKVFGEVTLQYDGQSPADPEFEPYLKMAEDLDIPMGIHIGPGPPGAVYIGFSKMRARLNSPTVLEEVLIKHPKLRIYAMHAGWPMLDDMVAMLYTYPQLYVDLGVIDYVLPQKEFDHYLQRLVDAGFSKRIMYGSDQMVWPEAISTSINHLKNASYLTETQKRDILFNNAVRFLRLSPAQIKAMY
jgi:predicted TIM-barrel fold metal-dependent hydrolase